MQYFAFFGRRSAVAVGAFLAVSAFAQGHGVAPAASPSTSNPTTASSASLATTVVIDAIALAQSGANTVSDIVARQAGIEFVRNGGPAGTTSLYVRGAPSQYTAVLVDGVRVDSQAGSGGMACTMAQPAVPPWRGTSIFS